MPVDYTIDTRLNVVFTRAWGELTDENVVQHQRRLRADPEFDPGGRQLVDMSQVEQFRLTSACVSELVDKDPWGPGARRAFFSPSDIALGMARMYEMLLVRTPQEISVFRMVQEARGWLGL